MLLQILQNLVNLLGISSSLNFAVMGGVILPGVLADGQLKRMRAVRPTKGGSPPAVLATAPRPRVGHEG